ncbi:MAG: type II toxin-antitoxin system VapC family toxin [Actinomycetota bacterium]|nr:type II toxin-antitoxin system VapC family toxin [Actinomycetota bacterium]
MTYFVDTSVIVYAGGEEHAQREPCRTVLRNIAEGSLEATTSTEVVQEILHRFARGRRQVGGRMARSVLDLFDQMLPIERATIADAVSRYENHPQLSARNALHVATCVQLGIQEVISVDTGFDLVTEVRRVEPAEASKSAAR